MDTIFSHIVQTRLSQSHEDVATDGLAFILRTHDAARQEFNKLLRGIVEQLSPDLHFRTQESDGSSRPDMCGFIGREQRVFIEKKFWAGLTENQPVTYLKRLSDQPQPTLLLFIVPRTRELTIWNELLKRLASAGISIENHASSVVARESVSTSIGPVLAVTSWETILHSMALELIQEPSALADLNQLQALCSAAESHAFVPFSAEEITDQRIPQLTMQLNDLIPEVYEAGITACVLDSDRGAVKPQFTWHRIGRYIKFRRSRVVPWIGTQFTLWKEHGQTPLWLEFYSSEYCRKEEVQPLLESWARRHGLPSVSSSEWFSVGLDIPPGTERDPVIRSLIDQLASIEKELVELPPSRVEAVQTDD